MKAGTQLTPAPLHRFHADQKRETKDGKDGKRVDEKCMQILL